MLCDVVVRRAGHVRGGDRDRRAGARSPAGRAICEDDPLRGGAQVSGPGAHHRLLACCQGSLYAALRFACLFTCA